jgi:hypothetical protein
MVHRKGAFTEIDRQKLLDAIGEFRRSLFEAVRNAPFRGEIHDAVESLSQAIRRVEMTLTGGPITDGSKIIQRLLRRVRLKL